MSGAVQSNDSGGEAHALACIAHCDRLASRFREAHQTSRRAAQLFQALDDVEGEAYALSIQTHSASVLGYNEEAVESGLLAVQLSAVAGNTAQQATAGIHLGVAYFFSKHHEKSDAVFADIRAMSSSVETPLNTFQVCVTQACGHLTRAWWSRYQSGSVGDLTTLVRLLDECAEMASAGRSDAIASGVRVSVQALWHLTTSVVRCWQGRLDAADAALTEADGWLKKYGLPTWLDAFAEVARAERAWAAVDWSNAELHAVNAIRMADTVEHEHAACVAHLLQQQILEAQGKNTEALAAHRALRRREQKMRAESLRSRAQVVEWQISLRREERKLQSARARSTQLERQALEDPLTGIANRRAFEQYLPNALDVCGKAGLPACLALFDVDSFKRVNDTLSHRVGDEVLKAVAGALRHHASSVHFAARLAGDEFVMVFPHAAHADALEVCARIQASLAAFEWNALGCNLPVTLSVGLVESQVGEDAQELLHRADGAMYEAKRAMQSSATTAATSPVPTAAPSRLRTDDGVKSSGVTTPPPDDPATGSTPVGPSPMSTQATLPEADAALDEGNVIAARRIAMEALRRGARLRDRKSMATALLTLAHCDRVGSRFRRAHGTCRRAARLFEQAGDVAGEAAARSALANAATCLGRNEEAVESALLGVRLAEEAGQAAVSQAIALNYLGVALLWGRDFAGADAALTASERALSEANQAGVFQALVNRLWAFVLQGVTDRFQTGETPTGGGMRELHDRCVALANAGVSDGMVRGSRVNGMALWLFGSAVFHCWEGRRAESEGLLERATEWASRYRSGSWLQVFEFWVRMEMAWGDNDWALAMSHCSDIVRAAEAIDYVQLASLGHSFACQIHQKAGQPAQALQASRKIRVMDDRVRADALAGREQAVDWLLSQRSIERTVQSLEANSRRLEHLSWEDPLTGIANRRLFESRLAAALADGAAEGVQTSVAFIDVNRFKAINDTYSHRVGDVVLQRIVTVVAEGLREQDLLARLAGDEFVVMLQRTSEAEAHAIAERLMTAVRGFDWTPIAQGLAVSVSVGTATSKAGDSAATLLDRSDAAMYSAKRLQVGLIRAH